MTKIILVHGINNEGNSKEIIERKWGDVIKKGWEAKGYSIPDDVSFYAAFYGDFLAHETNDWKNLSNENITPMGIASQDNDYIDGPLAAFYEELQDAQQLSDAEVAEYLDEVDDPSQAKVMAKGIHKRWLKAIAKALEAVLPLEGKYIVKAFIKQGGAYLYKPGLKKKIDDLVKTQVFSNLTEGEELIIVSHSLGTIITYDLLRKLQNTVKTKLYLTMGSPLGVNVFKKRIGDPLICLPNAQNWINVSDPEDMVALKKNLTGDTFGCDAIVNHSSVDNGDEDAHSALKYLSHDPVIESIYRAL